MNKKYCKKELNELQKLKIENQELKQEIRKLNNMLKRIDPDRPDIKSYQKHKEKIKKKKANKKLYKKWACYECKNGILRTIIFKKADSHKFYFRKCDSCEHKTKVQKYDKEKTEVVR